MFDFSKINMRPRNGIDFKPAATDAQIAELEKYCGHTLPENYKTILRTYHYSSPKVNCFHVMDEVIGIPGEYELGTFYFLDDNNKTGVTIILLDEQMDHGDIIAKNEFNFKAKVPFAEGLKRTIDWYKKQVNFPS